ncbi:MAG: hypothetical protein GC204_16535 [Chloroflexi bacterium]|nr:hypothetical protein [Chloroflexota bacterium]
MRVLSKWLWVAISILILSAGVVTAQTSPLDPIGTLQAGDFRALAITVDGDRLLVADAQNMQVRVYDFSDPANPVPLTSSDVIGTPVLLAGGEDFGLVALVTDGETDTVQTIAPPIPGLNAQYTPGGYIDIDKNPIALALSPDSHWGLAISEHGYTLMQINNPADVNAYEVGEVLEGAVFSNTTAYLLRGQNLEASSLDKLEAMHADETLKLGGTPTLVTLNADASAGVVVVDDNQLVFFSTTKLAKTGDFTVEGGAITSVHYLTKGNSSYLLVTQKDSNTVTVLDVADPANVEPLPGTQPLSKPIRALVVFKSFVIATDGVTISIFSA